MKQEIGAGIVKASPAVSYVGATVAGLSLPDWAAVAALLYSVAMLALIVWDRVVKPWRARRKA